MPGVHAESYLRNGMDAAIQEIKDLLTNPINENKSRRERGIKKDSELVAGVDGVLNVLKGFEDLKALNIQLFGEDGTKVPSANNLFEYADKCNECLAGIETIKAYLTNPVVDDKDVQKACSTFMDKYADTITLDLRPYLRVNKPAHNWKLSDAEKDRADAFIVNSKGAVAEKVKEHIGNVNELSKLDQLRWVEFPNNGANERGRFKISVPISIQLTGKVWDVAAYYGKHAQRLTSDTKEYLARRVDTMLYFDELEKKSKEQKTVPVFETTSSAKGDFSLVGYEGKYQRQSTFNGCWSCAYSMLLESRGVTVNQHMIRSFRPDMGVDDYQGLNKKGVIGLVEDKAYSLMELADVSLKVLSSSALRQVTIKKVNSGNRDAVKQQLIDCVREAIITQRSPVALNDRGHFLTIVGIEGNNFKVLNSNSTSTITLEQPLSIDKYISDNAIIDITWVHDLDFDDKGACKNIPTGYDDIRYKDGKLVNVSNVNELLNKKGNTFSFARRVGSAEYADTLYLPDSVPQKFLVKDVNPNNQKNVVNPVVNPIPVQQPVQPAPVKKEAPKPESTGVRKEILSEISLAHEYIIHIVNEWEELADPQGALRCTIATMFAQKTLLDTYDKIDITMDPEKEQTFAKLKDSREIISDIEESESFKAFYKSIKIEEIHKLCKCAPEESDAVIDRFYRKYVQSITNFQKGIEGDVQQNNVVIENYSDADSMENGRISDI